jgi:uncharacterized lipoprotein YehR (DUF1307 family)
VTKRIRTILLTAIVVSCVSAALSGCGKKEETKGDTPEAQQLRKDKTGD